MDWQNILGQPSYELRRESSQRTKRGTDYKPQINNSDISCHEPYQDSDYDHYREYMLNLTPCSSNCTKTSNVSHSITFDQKALDGLIKRHEGSFEFLNGNENETTPSPPSPCIDFIETTHTPIPSNVALGETKIEILRTNSHDKFEITLNDIIEYIEQELEQVLHGSIITRSQILETLTVNHLLIYILSHDTTIENIGYIRLFHLGRSYTPDKGISDPRYLTQQFYLKDLHLSRSPCFHLIVSNNEDCKLPELSEKDMLLKSFVWRNIVKPNHIPCTYAGQLIRKLKKIKSNVALQPEYKEGKLQNNFSTFSTHFEHTPNKLSRLKRICYQFREKSTKA
ncbi:hypothetical protein CAAN1_04S06590 [[Candida] anglica]|uniref:Uncharacterized protein n=1 Tax=[Candida] anglica TaxID=148631 RepID=A0ABP0E8H2_9ASCO